MVCQKFVADCTRRWVPEGAWVRGGLGALYGHPGAVPGWAGPPRSLWAERVTSLPQAFGVRAPASLRPSPPRNRTQPACRVRRVHPYERPEGTHRRAPLVNELLTHHTSSRGSGKGEGYSMRLEGVLAGPPGLRLGRGGLNLSPVVN